MLLSCLADEEKEAQRGEKTCPCKGENSSLTLQHPSTIPSPKLGPLKYLRAASIQVVECKRAKAKNRSANLSLCPEEGSKHFLCPWQSADENLSSCDS